MPILPGPAAATAATWDLNGTQNWSNNGGTSTNSKFLTFDNVTFDDSASAASNHTVNLGAQLTPASVTVNHSTGADYVIQGGGGIAGDTVSLTKTGTGVLTLSANNDTYGGGTFVKNGTVKLGSATGPTGWIQRHAGRWLGEYQRCARPGGTIRHRWQFGDGRHRHE